MRSLTWTAVAMSNFLAALSTSGHAWLNVAAGFLALAASFLTRKAS